MTFDVAGIEVSPLVPPVAGFLVAAVGAPAGVTGAFLLLPFQISVLGFTNPSVTPTNLLYNLLTTPGGIARYGMSGRLDWTLVRWTLAGTVPGVFIGAVARTELFAEPAAFKVFVGMVLLVLGIRLLVEIVRSSDDRASPRPRAAAVIVLAFVVGVIGGIYGIGGGAIIAPFLVGIFGMRVQLVAGAALVGTFVTSAAGILAFELLGPDGGSSRGPDWLLGLLFGAGGFVGSYVGALLQDRVPQRTIKALLTVLVLGTGAAYVVPVFA